MLLKLCLMLALLFAWPAAARQVDADPANYRELLRGLMPGDVLRLAPGVYSRGLPVHRLQGVPDAPIVISGPETGEPALFVAQPGHNTVSIVDAAYITIRHLELDGRHLPVDGVKAEGHAQWTHHITLEHLRIRNHGVRQQTVAISTKCPSWAWVVRNNLIIGAGTGMYFGNSDGSDAFVGGLIEHNLIVDTLGYNLQIKHQNGREDVPGMPRETQHTIIRHNVFSKARGAAAHPMARPNLLLGHWPLTGAGQDDLYLVYGNFFYQNPSEALFQGEGNIALYNNLFVNHDGDAIRIQPHNDIPRRISIFFNTLISSGAGIMIRPPRGDLAQLASVYPQWLTANLVFAPRPIEARQRQGNLSAPLAQAVAYLHLPLAPPGEMDLRPKKRLLAKFEVGLLHEYQDWDLDFDGRPRDEGVIGAYGGDAAPATWLPALEIKPFAGRR